MSNKTLSIVTALSLSSLTLAACAGSTAAGPRPVNVAQVRNEIADTIGRSHDSRSVVSMGKVTPERATVFTANGTGARQEETWVRHGAAWELENASPIAGAPAATPSTGG